MEDAAVRERIARVEARLDGLDERSLDAVAAVVELYGEALRRIAGRVPVEQLLGDELVSHLLLLHDLHPVDVETRVAQALEEVRPYLGSHGGGVELLGVEDGVVRLRLDGTCNGCPSSAATLTSAIEQAVRRAAPDVERVEAEGAVAEPAASGLLQIGTLTCPPELHVR
jgi:Fe-S cluster biogenesis protein NfuA